MKVGQARKRVLNGGAIKAVELLDISQRAEWEAGRCCDQGVACVQGSDAHALDQIGRRCTWLRLSELTLDGLRLAFGDPAVRIRHADAPPQPLERTWIESLHVSQGFFSDITFRFNPGLNCIVGGQGVGKSALIEFIRFVLNNRSEVPALREDHEGKLSDLLGFGGVVSVVICTASLARYQVSRRYDGDKNETWVHEVGDDGTLRPYPLEEIRRYLPVLAYSQGEGMSIARDVVRQLDLIDSHIDLSSEWDAIQRFDDELNANTAALMDLSRRLPDLEELTKRRAVIEKELATWTARIAEFEEASKEPAIRDHPAWEEERLYLSSLAEYIESLRRGVRDKLGEVAEYQPPASAPTSVLGNQADLCSAAEVAGRAQSLVEASAQHVDDSLAALIEELRAKPEGWLSGYREHKRHFNETNERIKNVQLGTLQDKQTKCRADLSRIEQAVRAASQRREKLGALLLVRQRLLNSIDGERARVYQKRRKQAREMTAALKGRVSVSVLSGGNRERYQAWLVQNLRRRELSTRNLEELSAADLTPRALAELLRQGDVGAISDRSGLSKQVSANLLRAISDSPELLFQLDRLYFEDRPSIALRRLGDEFKPIAELSTGQKFTVIILLALTEDDKPIVYDQPEDALDTAMIFTDIAQILRTAKDQRQFIFATHNSNMSVAADLDLAVVLEGSAREGRIQGLGGLEDSSVNRLLVTYLEGGTDAMSRRVSKYRVGES